MSLDLSLVGVPSEPLKRLHRPLPVSGTVVIDRGRVQVRDAADVSR